MQKELGRYLLPVSRKKYKTIRHLKKYPPKIFICVGVEMGKISSRVKKSEVPCF